MKAVDGLEARKHTGQGAYSLYTRGQTDVLLILRAKSTCYIQFWAEMPENIRTEL
jgi:hypothetical protein